MIFTLLTCCFFGISLLALLLAIHLFFRIKFELSELEMQLLARDIELKAGIKEQVKGSIDFHIRELAQRQASRALQKKNHKRK